MIQILYIEDEAGMPWTDVTVERLGQEGFSVDIVSGPVEAMQMIREGGEFYKAIIVDILMPPEGIFSNEETKNGTNTGIRLIEEFRKLLPTIPVLVVSVKPEIFHEDELEKNLFQGYLVKPVSPLLIAEKLHALLAAPGTLDDVL